MDQAVLQCIGGHALSATVAHDDRVAGQQRQFGVADVNAIAASDVQPERLERPLIETLLDCLAEY